VPQVNVPVPQPLSTVPQFLPVGHAVSGVHVDAQVPLELHTVPDGHAPFMEPQLIWPLHPLGTLPQVRVPQAAAAVSGVQPHTLATDGVPPPQLWGDVQAPQVTIPVHPSDTEPQFFPTHATAAVLGVQPHTLGVPPPPHDCGETQLLAQVTDCPQLFKMLPHRVPFPHVWVALSGRQPQTPVTPPPPQVSPVPAQVVGHCTVRPQLLRVGPHLPPAQVTDIASSVHALH
jgi:hypothetical protein